MVNRRLLLQMTNGSPIPAGCEIGVFETDTDESTVTISHSLGEVPKFAICLCIPNKAWLNIDNATILFEDLMSDPATGTYDTGAGSGHVRHDVASMGNNIVQATSTYTTYPSSMTSTNVTFATGRYYSGKFKEGYKYVYVLTK